MPKPAMVAIFLVLALLCSPFPSAGQQKTNAEPVRRDAGQQQDDDEVLKVDTNLVSIPVVASDKGGVYVPDMRKEEFTLLEDGVQQEIAFFATVTQPFSVILMLDTSASTEEKLGVIQRAAISFVEALQPADRVKVMSFDDEVRDLNAFTGEQAVIRRAIGATRPGKGTKLYDAMQTALTLLKPVRGRKAIVIFTDGVDFRSDSFRYVHNIRAVEESGVIVYPIRYDTKVETERLAREQSAGGGRPDLAAIITGKGGEGGPLPIPTGTTFPGGTVPGKDDGQIRIGGIPFPTLPAPPRRDDPRRDDPRRGDSRQSPYPEQRDSDSRTSNEDGLGMMLDALYKTADGYLKDLALKSGGKLTRADTLQLLPAAFKEIAAELRTQYAVGYYPSNSVKNGGYRKIKISASRKGTSVRTRPGYSAVAVP